MAAFEEKKRIQEQIEALNKNIQVMKIKERKKRYKVSKEENSRLLSEAKKFHARVAGEKRKRDFQKQQ